MKKDFLQQVFCLLVLTFAIFSTIKAQDEKLQLEILNGHSGGGVLSVAVSGNGKFALTGSTDKTALLWDLETGKQLRRFVGHENAVSVVQFSKDGQFVLTASHDKTARLWETATGRQIRVFVENRNGLLVGHSDKILSAAISADGNLVATAGEDKTARIWDLKTGKQLFQIEHAGRVNSIAFSPDSALLLTGGEDKIARLFSTQTGKEERKFVGHIGDITSVAYSPDGRQILTGSADNTVRLWIISSTNEIRKIEITGEVSNGLIKVVLFNSNGRDVIVGSESYPESIQVWNLESGKKVWDDAEFWELNYESYTWSFFVSGTTFDEDKILLVNGRVRLIDTKTNKVIRELYGKSDVVNTVDAALDLRHILSGGENYTTALWNGTEGKMKQFWRELNFKNLETTEIDVRAAALSPNENTYAITDDNAYFITLRIKDSKILQAFDHRNDENKNANELPAIKSLKFSNKGDSILSSNGKNAFLWQVETKEPAGKVKPNNKFLLKFEGHKDSINNVAFSPDDKTIATASDDETVRLWNTETGEVKQIIKDFLAPVWSVAFSPDGKTIATASGGAIDMSKIGIGDAGNANSVQLWDVETGKKIEGFGQIYETVINKFTGFKSVAYSPDKEGRYIAAGTFDGKVYLRDNQTKTLRKFEGHTDAVNSVKFAKDALGNLLVVSGSSDSTTRIWNAATGEEVCSLVTFRDGNWAVVQTKTGRYDAPNGGEINGIQWVFGNETIALSQLKDIYYTPNLLPRLLGYKNDKPLAQVPDLKTLKLFPKIIEQKLDEQNARLTVRLQNRGGGIGAVRVMVNGSLAIEDARDAKTKANPNAPEAVVTFDLKGSAGLVQPIGSNKIEIITNNYDATINKGYISSNPVAVSRGTEIIYTENVENDCRTNKSKCPTLHAIIGGVSDYNGEEIKLRYAAKDAEDFANALGIGARRLFCPPQNQACTDKVKIKLLTTSGKTGTTLPTKPNIRAAFEEVAREAKPQDIVVVYFAGHGTSIGLDNDTYFFITQEAEKISKEAIEKNPNTAISSVEIQDWLTQTEWITGTKGVQARHQVLILDTCAAGAFLKSSNDKLTTRARDLPADQIKAIERLKDRTGLQVLMGSAADQYSYEASQYGQGILTYALLQGMKGAKLRDGKFVDTQLLFGYAKDKVEEIVRGLNNGVQQPRVFGTSGGIDIGLMTEKDRESIKLESIKPFMLRPSFALAGRTNRDTINLSNEVRAKFVEASEVKRRGDGLGTIGATLVYIDEDSFSPDSYSVTGTYTIENGEIKLAAFLWRGEIQITELRETPEKPEITGKDVNETAEKLFQAALRELTKTQK